MVVNNIVVKLKQLGFSEYESRAYLALLRQHPATAYEIARTAEIPTSKIYQVVNKLLRRGLVQPVELKNKNQYIPQAPGEFLKTQKQSLEKTFVSLEKDFSSLGPEPEISFLWNIRQYSTLLEKAEQIIREAKNTLLLSVWQEELNLLLAALQQAEKSGTRIAIVHFGKTDTRIGQLYLHPIERTIYTEKGGRGLGIVADAKTALVATVSAHNKVEGAWSINRGFVTLAEDYIKHDIYIMKIVARFDRQLIKYFGEGYYKLRDVFSDEEVNHENLH